MNKPAAFLQRISMSDGLGQPRAKSQSLRVLAMSLTGPKEQPDVTIHQRTFDVMEPEHFRDRSEWLETKPGADSRFRTTVMKNLAVGIRPRSGRARKEWRRQVHRPCTRKGIDDDEGRNAGSFERADDDFFKLGAKRFAPISGLVFRTWSNCSRNRGTGMRVEMQVLGRSLNVAPVLKVSRTEETCAQFSLSKGDLGKRLGDG